jgi:hypothetical protein
VETATNSLPPTPHTRPRSLFHRIGPFLVIAGFVLAVLYRLVLLGEALYWGDIYLYFYPLEQHVGTSIRAGELPLWNPYVLCGQPLVGNPQSWVFYPSTLLLTFLPVWLYFTVNTLLHLVIAGVGTYLFTRRLTADRLGAILAGITYAASGFLIARLQFPTMVQSAAYLPWLLIMVDRIIDRPRIWHAALLALMVMLELLAAHTQLAYMSFGCATLYALARLYQIRRHKGRARRAFGEMVGALVVGILGASVQLLPALQLFGLSTRERLTFTQANRFLFLPEHLVNFIFPRYYGDPALGDYWGEGNLWEPCVYLGILPLVLAGYAVYRSARRPAVRFFALAGLIALWLAMGRFGGIFWLAYYAVPGLASFHDPARFTFITTFAFAVLAAIGLRALRERGVQDRYRAAIVALAALNLWAFSAHLDPTLDPASFAYRSRVLAYTPSRGEGRVFTALRDTVWKRYLNYSDYGPDSARYAHELTDTLAPNIGMRFGVEEGSGYEPVPIRAVTQVDGLVRQALDRQSPELPRLLALFNAHTLLLPQSTRFPHPELRHENARGVTALTVKEQTPRAWLVRKTVRIDGAERALAALTSPDFDPFRTAVVSGSNGLGDHTGTTAPRADTVSFLRSDAHRIVVDVNARPDAAFLVWSAAWYPGWRVAIDGSPALLEQANHAFCGVVVPAGRHRVEFRYDPVAVRLGLYLTLIAAAVILGSLTYGAVVRPHERRLR